MLIATTRALNTHELHKPPTQLTWTTHSAHINYAHNPLNTHEPSTSTQYPLTPKATHSMQTDEPPTKPTQYRSTEEVYTPPTLLT